MRLNFLTIIFIIITISCAKEQDINDEKTKPKDKRDIKKSITEIKETHEEFSKILLPGLEYIEKKAVVDTFVFTIFAVRFNQNKYTIKILGLNEETGSGYTLQGFQYKTESLITMNGGFRTRQNLPVGLVITEGNIKNRISNGLSGILTVIDNKINIINLKNYSKSQRYDYALQAGPLIVDPGGKQGIPDLQREIDKGGPFPRTFIAIDNAQRIIMGVTTNTYLYNLSKFLRKTEAENGFECDVALNLDGAGNRGLLIKVGDFEKDLRTKSFKRPNAVAVFNIK